jgi:hypothetical protein
MTDSANELPLTPANDNAIFQRASKVLFELFRLRREMLSCNVSVLPSDKQRQHWNDFQELDKVIGRVLSCF